MIVKRGRVGLSWTGESNRESFFSFFSLVYKWKLITWISCLGWLVFCSLNETRRVKEFCLCEWPLPGDGMREWSH